MDNLNLAIFEQIAWVGYFLSINFYNLDNQYSL